MCSKRAQSIAPDMFHLNPASSSQLLIRKRNARLQFQPLENSPENIVVRPVSGVNSAVTGYSSKALKNQIILGFQSNFVNAKDNYATFPRFTTAKLYLTHQTAVREEQQSLSVMCKDKEKGSKATGRIRCPE
ncbi:hypothetical protein HUJ05_000541 [Dendroctonus ponderosae]|nr:hypothetical protein HUJ05_000541 [Dendroctonus ponderosae]